MAGRFLWCLWFPLAVVADGVLEPIAGSLALDADDECLEPAGSDEGLVGHCGLHALQRRARTQAPGNAQVGDELYPVDEAAPEAPDNAQVGDELYPVDEAAPEAPPEAGISTEDAQVKAFASSFNSGPETASNTNSQVDAIDDDARSPDSDNVPDDGPGNGPLGECPGKTWCGLVVNFSKVFDRGDETGGDPQAIQQALDTYGSFHSAAEGVSLALTDRDYYVMYHQNVQRVLQTYMQKGDMGWNFETDFTEVPPRENNGNKVHVLRNGVFTLKLGWKKTLFFGTVVRTLPHKMTFPWTQVTSYSDCTNCPAKMLMTLENAAPEGAPTEWKVSEILIIKMS